MEETRQVCPECGAVWYEEKTCQDHFHQMLFWENENPRDGLEVHHLMVLCYHLQHPRLYSPEGLRAAMRLLADFLERGVTPEDVRRHHGATVDSHTRRWNIKGTPTSHGVYTPPIHWTMTADQMIASGQESYGESVRTWARSVYEALKTSGHFSWQE
jgi:hypothetical protein